MTTQQAPNFTLTHVAGPQVSLSDYRGRTIVLVFAGRESSNQGQQILQTLRSRYDVEALPLISIVDMHGVPKLMQGVAKGRMQSGYQEFTRDLGQRLQAAGRPVPPDPSQIVVMLLDLDGKVTASFGLSGVDRQAVAVLVDGNGTIRGYGAGSQGGEQILALFDQH